MCVTEIHAKGFLWMRIKKLYGIIVNYYKVSNYLYKYSVRIWSDDREKNKQVDGIASMYWKEREADIEIEP
jgi:hypothetical protein